MHDHSFEIQIVMSSLNEPGISDTPIKTEAPELGASVLIMLTTFSYPFPLTS